MILNYLKVTWRNFKRNKFYTLINILGLSIGFGCLILISLFIYDELSYDDFHEKSGQIHFIAREAQFGDEINKGLSTPFPLGQAMKESLPEVQSYITMTWPGVGEFSKDGEKYFGNVDILYTTHDFFNIFSFPLSIGNPKTVLDQSNSVVITREIAQKYFPNEDPLGKTIKLRRYDDREFVISGIAENLVENSYLEFDFVASINDLPNVQSNRDRWSANMYHTYAIIQNGKKWEDIEKKLASLVDSHLDEDSKTVFFSIPITDLYLSDLVSVSGIKGKKTYIYIFSAIAFLILLLASINYMNLSTARASQRSKEVGLRKVIGAHRAQLINQFIGESVLIAIISFVIGLQLTEFSLPFFNDFVDKDLNLNLISNITLIFSLFGVSIIVGVLSGSYPAFFLSRFMPAEVLKGEAYKNLSGAALRRLLVVGQFALSTILIICTLTIFDQLHYMQNKDLGFSDEKVMYIPNYKHQDQTEFFEQKAEQHSGILVASAATAVPGRYNYRIQQAFDQNKPQEKLDVHFVRTDPDYMNVLDLRLVAGRYFDKERSTDRDTARVVNESFLKELGWTPEKAIGKRLNDGSKIIGVLENYHFKSLHHKIEPILIRMKPSKPAAHTNYNLIIIKFNPSQVENVINYLQESWDSIISDEPMPYYFLDEKFAEQYESDQKLRKAFTVFAVIAVMIACMGLWGLAAFSAERRTKEIGIRKVLGANVKDILILLNKDFLLLVLMGFLIAIPFSWYSMNIWLQNFAYRIEIEESTLILAGLCTLAIALAVVIWQSISAALSDPIKCIRSD